MPRTQHHRHHGIAGAISFVRAASPRRTPHANGGVASQCFDRCRSMVSRETSIAMPPTQFAEHCRRRTAVGHFITDCIRAHLHETVLRRSKRAVRTARFPGEQAHANLIGI